MRMRFMGFMTSGNTGGLGGNLMRFMVNPLIKYRSTPQEVKDVILPPDMGPACLYMGAFMSNEK